MTTKEELSNNDLKSTLGLAVSVIATEHFMSAGLSSPWSVAKFAVSDQDKQEVWNYFDKAAIASLGFGALISYKLKSIWPVVSSGVTVIYYKKLYADALSRTPTQNPTVVLTDWKPLSEIEKAGIESILSIPFGNNNTNIPESTDNNLNNPTDNITSNYQDIKYGYLYRDFS